MSDRLELQDLLISYSEAIDRREFDELDALFTPDAYIDYRDTGGIEGRYPQIKEWLAETLPAYFERNAHMLGLPAIKLAGDTATARTFCFNPMVLKGDKARSCRSASGTTTSSSAPPKAGGSPVASRSSATTRSSDVGRPSRDSPGSGCSGTMGGCLSQDHGPAMVTHVRQNRIRAFRP